MERRHHEHLKEEAARTVVKHREQERHEKGEETPTNRRKRPMQLKDIMTPKPDCVRPDDTLQEAARRMRDLDVGPRPVCGDDDRLAGMITDRDITVRAVAGEHDLDKAAVRDFMTPKVIFCFE